MGAEIVIKNEEGALKVCESILKYNNELEQHIECLNDLLRNVNMKWESNAQDKESYIIELDRQINTLVNIKEQLNSFAKGIIKYVEYVKKESQNKI